MRQIEIDGGRTPSREEIVGRLSFGLLKRKSVTEDVTETIAILTGRPREDVRAIITRHGGFKTEGAISELLNMTPKEVVRAQMQFARRELDWE